MAGTLNPQFGTIQPSQQQQLLNTNYLQFNDPAGADFSSFAEQYLPEIYEQEVERYGNRTLSGFLRMVGAEMPMTSDQVITFAVVAGPPAVSTITMNAADTNVISVGDTVVVLDQNGAEAKCYVSASTTGLGGNIVVEPYTAADLTAAGLVGNVKVFVYGSEYAKGSTTPNYNSIEPAFTSYSNTPIIIRSQYQVNGSDMAQIGWVEIATEDGASGYLWYLKAESETRLRFEDYLEMSVVEGEIAAAGSAALANGQKGTQGLFAAIKDRGNELVGFAPAAGTVDDFDNILRNLDTQGAIEENMLFLNRDMALAFDDMLAGLSSGADGGTAYGLFENSAEMALNLGFSGFRRGSYDFYKTDWKYLNDASTRGGFTGTAAIEGVLIPAGTSTVYDQVLGTNIRRPFLHVRYRASQADDRRMKSWLTGSAGGAFTSDLDAMQVNFLSERCLVTQAANNFVIFTAV
jgi:hypothetical protein